MKAQWSFFSSSILEFRSIHDGVSRNPLVCSLYQIVVDYCNFLKESTRKKARDSFKIIELATFCL